MRKSFVQNINYKYSKMKLRYRLKKQRRTQKQSEEIPKAGMFKKLRGFCIGLADVKPSLWLLFLAAVISIGCIMLILPVAGSTDGVRTYRYNALPLKYTSGQVRILAKSGYAAYEGRVSKGAANGKGTLYRKDGSLVYDGEFQNNKYQGEGKSYFEGNQLQYEGQFVNNQFHGQGVLYRKDGTKEYEGTFSLGEKQGEGKLYDAGGGLVYNGNFVKGIIRYQELLGKTVTEVTKMYTGKRVVYENNSEYCVSMEDIDSIYVSQGTSNTLEQEGIVQGVYVLSPSIVLEGKEYKSIKELKKKFKLFSYEGNTSLSMADAVAVNVASKKKEVLSGAVSMDTEAVLDDVITVNNVDKSYQVYVYQMEDENIVYTFFAKEKGDEFDFYLMEQK